MTPSFAADLGGSGETGSIARPEWPVRRNRWRFAWSSDPAAVSLEKAFDPVASGPAFVPEVEPAVFLSRRAHSASRFFSFSASLVRRVQMGFSDARH